MKELLNTFFKHLIIASTWGLVFLVVFFVSALGIKQEIKEAIQYTARTTVAEVSIVLTDPFIIREIKKNIKKGIEFSADTLNKEIKELLIELETKKSKKNKEG